MTSSDSTSHFANSWIDAWNSHDVEQILSHYADDVIYYSPFVARLQGNLDGRLMGKSSLRPYFQAALTRFPDLRFVLRHVFAGAHSLVIEYESVESLLAAETFVLDANDRVSQVFCHYRSR